MDNKLYLIHEDDYLRHIDQKLEMYDLVLELVRTLRDDLAEGETARAVRDLCSYEQDAHIMFECWTIPDAYVESLGDTAYLSRLMEKELLPADDEDDEEEYDEEEDGEDASDGKPLSRLLLEAANMLADSAASLLSASGLASDMELEDLMRRMDEAEKPENDCAG